MAQYPFKAEEIKTFKPLEAGSYRCEIIKTDVMATKDGHGRYVSIQFRIIEGEYKGRIIFQRLNVLNRSTKCEEIGKKQLSSLCHSIGIDSFDDTDEMLNCETIVNLENEGQLKMYNGFSKVDNSIPEIKESNGEIPQIIPVSDFEDDKIPF